MIKYKGNIMSLFEIELEKLKVFENNLPNILTEVADSIPSNTIPYRMKLAIAVSELVRYTSQFRINILHWNGSSIPINAITFCIAKSGASKDSSVSACRKCFEESYNLINVERETAVKNTAMKLALEAGEEEYMDFNTYKNYIIPAPPLVIGISTIEGLIQNLADSYKLGIGSGYLYSGEIGQELASNTNTTDCVKAIAETYDEGNKEVKALKDKSSMTEIKNMPMNAMFMGSTDNLLFDESIKKKFKTEFTTKLGRRSFFIFVNEDMPKEEFNSITECINKDRIREDKAKVCREKVSKELYNITNYLLNSKYKEVTVSEDVRNLFILYTRYNEELASKIDNHFSIAKLSRTHLQWKALKTAGSFALLDCSNEIKIEHYKAAIEYCELTSSDISLFERELVKEPYEIFSDCVKELAINNKAFVTLHTLRKLGYIPIKGNPQNKLKELVQLVSSYDKEGIYSIIDDGISYSKLVKTDTLGISYKVLNNLSKDERHKQSDKGFVYENISFDKLGKVLITDTVFTPFRFLNGKRSNDNIDSSCKWLAFDIDKSNLTDEEVHIQLSDINHHIARTSDVNNPNKFRLLIELDAEIDIPNSMWKPFITAVAEELGLDIDILPKSQIFYGYATSKDTLLSITNQKALEVKPICDSIIESSRMFVNEKVSKVKASTLLNDPENTFYKAYQAKDGEGSRKLIWAAKKAKELGASKQYILDLINDINDSWYIPMNSERLEKTILTQIRKFNIE
jgi:hypothetical protein